MTGFEDLAEGCIVSILSRTTLVDVGRLSLVSKTFLSSADSDAVWNHFLPSDIDSIISLSPSLANAPSKKALYLALSDRPIIIDDGKKSFQLDKKSGKKCCMLAARSLTIVWGDDNRNWIAMPDSRFLEVANLRLVWRLEIRGMINNLALSPTTQYAVYLVFRLIDAYEFENLPVDLSVDVEGGQSSTKIVCLDPNVARMPYNREARFYVHVKMLHYGALGLFRPSVRSDGWLEIEVGEFFNSGLENEEVQMSIKACEKKGNFFLEGIEIKQHSVNYTMGLVS